MWFPFTSSAYSGPSVQVASGVNICLWFFCCCFVKGKKLSCRVNRGATIPDDGCAVQPKAEETQWNTKVITGYRSAPLKRPDILQLSVIFFFLISFPSKDLSRSWCKVDVKPSGAQCVGQWLLLPRWLPPAVGVWMDLMPKCGMYKGVIYFGRFWVLLEILCIETGPQVIVPLGFL